MTKAPIKSDHPDHPLHKTQAETHKADVARMPKPSLGRIVHFVDNHAELPNNEQAAIITAVNDDGTIDLTTFPDNKTLDAQLNAALRTVSHGGVIYSAEKLPGTWHWPERE